MFKSKTLKSTAAALMLGAAFSFAVPALVVVPDASAKERVRAGKAAQGSSTRERTVTGQNGRSNTVRTERTRDRDAGTYSKDRTRTYNDGSTRTTELDTQKTGEGAWSANRTVTGRNGETRTQSGDFTAEKTESGRVITGDIQTEKRGQIDYTKEVSRGEDGRSVNSSATFEDGTAITRSSTSSCVQGAGCSSQTAVTNRQGETTTIAQTRTKTEDGWTKNRETTLPNGGVRTTTVDGQKTETGANVTRTVVTPQGETRTQTGAVTVTKTP
jgi:hypothetical protein